MEELNELISKLNKKEISLIANYLEHLTLKKKEDSKMMMFYNFLVKRSRKDPSAHECANYVYGKNADGKFRMLKSKMRSRILDALVMDKNISASFKGDSSLALSLRARKRVMDLNYIIFSKGVLSIVPELIDEIVAIGIKYENYSSILEALKLKKYLKGFTKNLEEFLETNKRIAFYEYCDQAKGRAADHYYKLIARKDFQSSWSPTVIEKYLQEAIIELKRDFKYTQSGFVGYYLKILEIAYFQNQDDYMAARNSSVELLSIIKKYTSVYRKERVAIAFDNIGECDIFLCDFERAVSNFRSAQAIFPKHSQNLVLAQEMEFKALFYWNKFEETGKALARLKGEIDMSIGDFRISKYSFYHACILFKQGNYKDALREVSQHLELSKDKAGWDIALRVLGIMCNLEMERMDEAALQEESLRKHIDRLKKEKQEISQRDILIGRVLHESAKKGFMFSSLPAKTIEKIQALAGSDKKYRWQPLIPEMIPFHAWIAEKAKLQLPKPRVEKSVKRKLKKVNLN